MWQHFRLLWCLQLASGLVAPAARASGAAARATPRRSAPLDSEDWAGAADWADAIAAFEDEDDEAYEEGSGAWGPRLDAPGWVRAAVAARGDDAEAALAPLTSREREVVVAR